MAKPLQQVRGSGWSLSWVDKVSGKLNRPRTKTSAPMLNLGMPVRLFLRHIWQQKALLARQAIPEFVSPISANDLAGIACQRHALARVVRGSGKRFKLDYGPFDEASFAGLGKRNWTLLVQQVDQWDEEVAKILAYFAFLPRWRIEDVMVSYAVRGGSVGAHVDQYDVFLLQARGKRRWQIDSRPAATNPVNQKLVAGAKLKLLANFEPEHDWVLEPGDILYLPPGVPHHGVAESDDCMTFSIGLRAPSLGEMLTDLGRQALFDDNLRYRDGELNNSGGGAMTLNTVAQVRATLSKALALSDAKLGAWFANFMSGYRSVELPELKPLRAGQGEYVQRRLKAGQQLAVAPGVRAIAFLEGIHIGGRFLACGATLKMLLSNGMPIDDSKFWAFPAQERDLLAQLLAVRALRFVPVIR